MQGLVNQPGTGVIPFQAARTTTDVQLLSNVASGSYVYSNEAVQVGTSAPVVAEDPYVKLLLHMDGANASTTFTDSSPLNKTVTKYTNAQISTAQSKFGGASGYFNSSGDYLSVPYSEDYNLPADFSIDAWIRLTAYSPYWGSSLYAAMIACTYASTGADTGWQLYVDGTVSSYTKINLWTGTTLVARGFTFALNAWYHIAVTRSSGVIRMFVDGTQVGVSAMDSALMTQSDANHPLLIAKNGDPTYVLAFPGYIDELRISKGIAYWTANFTPPTSAYVLSSPGIDQYTKLLLHCDGTNASTTFTDSEILAKTVTAYGNAQISTAQSVFGGASMLLDGTGDSVGTPDSADFDVAAGDFTVDFWVRRGTTGTQQYLFGQSNSAGDNSSCSVYATILSNNTISFVGLYAGGASNHTATSTGTITSTTAWVHLAFVRNGATMTIYINGTADGTVNCSTTTFINSSNRFSIGALGEYTSYYLNGYIDEFRFSKGIARWTANFTPPTQSYALPGIDPYTKLALHMDGADSSTTFTDSCAVPKTVTRYGDAQIKTAQSKFGGASGYFDGTGDYVDTPDSSDFDVGSGDFTVDCWVRRGATGAAHTIFGQIDGSGSNANGSILLRFTAGNLCEAAVYSGATSYTAASSATYTSTTAWYHVALIRNGNNLNLYVDGTQVGTTSVAGITVNNSAYKAAVGRNGEYTSNYFNGYIDEFRFSKGIARWTTNFTPPDRAYENQDSSVQLIPAISTATAASQLQVTSAGALNTYGATAKRYSGFVSKTEVGTI